MHFGGCDVPQSAICKQENRESRWCNSIGACRAKIQELWYWTTGEDGCPSSKKARENSPFLNLFVLAGPLTNWLVSTHIGEGESTYFSTESKPNVRETPSQTQPEIMFYQLSGHLLGQSSWYMKLRIIYVRKQKQNTFLRIFTFYSINESFLSWYGLISKIHF